MKNSVEKNVRNSPYIHIVHIGSIAAWLSTEVLLMIALVWNRAGIVSLIAANLHKLSAHNARRQQQSSSNLYRNA